MDRIQRHLQTIPISTIAFAAVLMIVIALLAPKKAGFYVSVFMMCSWINLDRFQELRFLSSAAKVTYWLPPVLLIFFASFLPGPRRKVPTLAWVYPICSLLGIMCIMSARDVLLGAVQFSTMFLYSLAGIALYRVTTTRERLNNVVLALFLGILVPIAVALSALFLFQNAAFGRGLGRFFPFGMNPNQYMHYLATGSCLAACGFFSAKTQWVKLFCLATIAACGTLVVFSGSRQGLVIVSFVMLPSIAWGLKTHPISLSIGAACAVAIGIWIFTFSGKGLTTDRITDLSDTSGRFETAKEYVGIFLSRPTGLLGTSGRSVNQDERATHIPHNSYLRMAYLGGVLLIIPLCLVLLKSSLSTLYVLSNRERSGLNDKLLLSLGALLFGIYLNGLVSDMIYFAISSWCFLHYFLSCLFMGIATELKRPRSLF